MEDLISIIVPIYNTEEYLDRCINSLVCQTYKNIEIVLVDDGSNDRCPQICDEWAEKDRRVTVVHQKNIGVSGARHSGVKASNGKYVFFLDSDDWIEFDTVEYLYNIVKQYDVPAARICAIQCNSNTDFNNLLKDHSDDVEVLCFVDIIKEFTNGLDTMCCVLYLKSLFDNLPELPMDLAMAEDTLFSYFLMKKAKKMAFSKRKMYYYFRHDKSRISGVITNEMIDSGIKVFDIIERYTEKNDEDYPYVKYCKIMTNFFLINSVIRNNRCMERFEELRERILKDKEMIFSTNMFSARHKIGVALLMISPKLYAFSIIARKKQRGY